jgi:hypothetical protein
VSKAKLADRDSALRGDTWTCVGGPQTLTEALEHDLLVQVPAAGWVLTPYPQDETAMTRRRPKRKPGCYRDT